ncbi:hypothetical protein [Sinomonas sp. G460-2]
MSRSVGEGPQQDCVFWFVREEHEPGHPDLESYFPPGHSAPRADGAL